MWLAVQGYHQAGLRKSTRNVHRGPLKVTDDPNRLVGILKGQCQPDKDGSGRLDLRICRIGILEPESLVE